MFIGGGNQFGIIVEFLFKTHPSAGPFSVGTLIYEGSEVPRVLKAIQVRLKLQSLKGTMIF